MWYNLPTRNHEEPKKYLVKTGKDSYTYITHKTAPESKKESYAGLLFDKSLVSVLTGRGFIKEIEVLEGICYAPGIPKVKIPFAEFIEYPMSNFW